MGDHWQGDDTPTRAEAMLAKRERLDMERALAEAHVEGAYEAANLIELAARRAFERLWPHGETIGKICAEVRAQIASRRLIKPDSVPWSSKWHATDACKTGAHEECYSTRRTCECTCHDDYDTDPVNRP